MKHIFYTNLGAAFLLLAVAGSLESVADNSQYRWENSRGEPVYSDRPPPDGVSYEVIKSQPTLKWGVPGADGDVPQESDSSESEDGKSNNNVELCQRAKTNLRMLESPDKVSERDEKGELRELSPKERTVMQQTAKAEIDVYCD